MKYKPLNMFLKQTDELRKMILEHPDYPIVVIVNSEVVGDDFYNWWYAPDLSFSLGEILDCEQDIDDEKTYTNREEFMEDIEDRVSWNDEYENLSDNEIDKIVENIYRSYEPYWKKVIQIRADV